MFGRLRLALLLLLACAALGVFVAPLAGQAPSSGAAGGPAFVPPRTPWGDPDLQGSYSNSNESLIPLERPDGLEGRSLDSISADELAALNEERNQARIEADKQRWELRSPLHWFENHDPTNSRAWLVVDPPDGKVPPQVPAARARAAARGKERAGRGPADSYTDRSLYDRCITRGLPGSMMPAIYGSSYEIVQGPGYVAIAYEMVNELRVIPLDGRPHVGGAIRHYMGDARGHFEGNTLVVETTNFTDKVPYRGSSERLRLVERFTPVGPETVEWAVTFDDPDTWERPWTFAMNLSKVDEPPFEYACHEGNYAIPNIMSIERQADADAAAGAGGQGR